MKTMRKVVGAAITGSGVIVVLSQLAMAYAG